MIFLSNKTIFYSIIFIVLVVIAAIGIYFYSIQNRRSEKVEDVQTTNDVKEEIDCKENNKSYYCLNMNEALHLGDSSSCLKIKDKDLQFACITAVAVSNKTSKECEKIDDEDYRTVCKIAVAKETQDYSICKSIQREIWKDACLFYFQNRDKDIIIDTGNLGKALDNNDRSFCDKISYKNFKDVCYSDVKN